MSATENSPSILNPHRGKYDEGLSKVLEAHDNNPALVLDTVMEFLTRETGMPAKPGLQTLIRGLASKANDVQTGGASKQKRVSAPQDAFIPGRADHSEPPELLRARAAARQSRKLVEEEVQRMREESMNIDGIRHQSVEMQLPVHVDPEAHAAFEKAAQAGGGSQGSGGPQINDAPPKLGTKCKHAGCNRKYEGPESEGARCIYHPGNPVFHEGEKYWSCCRKRTIDFAEFLSTPGCARGRCTFKEAKESQLGRQMPRYDMMESGTQACMTIYARKVDPKSIKVVTSARRLKIQFLYDVNVPYDVEVDLAGEVVPQGSSVEVTAPIMEVRLKKGDGTYWGKIGRVIDQKTGVEVQQHDEFART